MPGTKPLSTVPCGTSETKRPGYGPPRPCSRSTGPTGTTGAREAALLPGQRPMGQYPARTPAPIRTRWQVASVPTPSWLGDSATSATTSSGLPYLDGEPGSSRGQRGRGAENRRVSVDQLLLERSGVVAASPEWSLPSRVTECGRCPIGNSSTSKAHRTNPLDSVRRPGLRHRRRIQPRRTTNMPPIPVRCSDQHRCTTAGPLQKSPRHNRENLP